jgi:hypothetical protein
MNALDNLAGEGSCGPVLPPEAHQARRSGPSLASVRLIQHHLNQ